MIFSDNEAAVVRQRPMKRSAAEICRDLGLKKVEDFWLAAQNLQPEDFVTKAFPEFPPDTRGGKSLLDEYGIDFAPGYIAAYELTYRHHYEMQGEWREIVTDIEARQYTGVDPVVLQKNHPWGYTGEHDFESFEQAILCIANEGYYKRSVQKPWTNLGGNLVTSWICRWRRRLGRPVLAGVDDNPAWHSLVWRDNWKAVRDEVAVLNVEDYPDDRGDYVFEDAYDYLRRGESLAAAVAELADRLVREAGWPEAPWEARRDNPGYWSTAALDVAKQIAEKARWFWRAYIEEKSGRKLKVLEKELYYYE